MINLPVRLRRTVDESHTIRIGRGLGPRISVDLRRWHPGRRFVIVTDSHLKAGYGRALRASLQRRGLPTDLIAFPAGEASKTRRMRDRVEDRLIALGAGRDTTLVALGGGVVSDLTGFVAATFNRGIPIVHVPTTLIGMVDAAIGGKTGVNHPAGKNFLGAFHQSAGVYIDVEYLKTLPARHFKSGLAEVVKCGVIADRRLFESLEGGCDRIDRREPEFLSRIIEACCRIKVRVVVKDPGDSNRRKILNFGHTVGHALETLSKYRMAHGEAVSIGMVAEARLAARAGLLSQRAPGRVEALLIRLGLPTTIPRNFRPGAILAVSRRDKKARRGRVILALPARIGAMANIAGEYGILLDEALIVDVLSSLRR